MNGTIVRVVRTVFQWKDRGQSIVGLFFELFHYGTCFARLDRHRDKKCPLAERARRRESLAAGARDDPGTTRDRMRRLALPRMADAAYRQRAVHVLPPERGDRRDRIEPTPRDVAARGARIRFVEAGEGPPLVLVHDYLASRVAWDDVLPGLARRFRVIAPDLPGFGESEKPPPGRYRYDFDAFCESLTDLVAALGLGRVSMCGHAMGGAVALTVAAKHAHVIDKLVLVSPLIYPPRADTLSRIASVPIFGPLLFKQLYGRALFRSRFRGSGAGGADSAVSRRVDQLFDLFDVPAAREAAYATMRAMLDTRPLTASIPRVKAPTLVVWGRGNRTSPVEQGRRLARELGGARFEVFDCGRAPAEECPEEFTRAVTDFLANGPGC